MSATMNHMKQCWDCGQEKPVSEFNRNANRKDGLQSSCRDCQCVRNRSYYVAHRTTMRRQIVAAKARRRAVLQQFVLDHLRSHPCVDCGEMDLLVLDFDHVRGVKTTGIAELIARERPLSVLQAEVAKCEVRCANCHRRKTMREQGGYRWLAQSSLLVTAPASSSG